MSIIMKRILLLCLFIITAIVMKSQSNLPYKPLSAFGNDTIAYLVYNFDDRADYYKGKTVKDIIGDLQIPIVYYKYKYTPRAPQNHLLIFFDTNIDIIEGNYLVISSNARYLKYVPYKGDWTAKTLESLKSIKAEAIRVSVPRGSKYYKEKEIKSTDSKPEYILEDVPVFHKWDPDNP